MVYDTVMSYICGMELIYTILFFVALVAVFSFGIRKLAQHYLLKMKQRNEGKTNNTYILRHLAKVKNDMDYEEYIEWMDKNNISSAPIKKAVTPEDATAKNKINELFR